ncbi:MAG: hypothetical protein SVX43_11850 [Cyanobacteriota bacterium]|nr:hypothetical protein [Cyanobacteriota bacterium]
MPLQAFSTWTGTTAVARDRDASASNRFLNPLNLFELSRELDQPLSPITSLEDLQEKTDRTLQALEKAFLKASEFCSHWTIGSLFGSTPIACYLERLLHKKTMGFDLKDPKKCKKESNLNRFGRSLFTEIAVSLSLDFIFLMHSYSPAIALLSLVSTSFIETLVQHFFDLISLQSFGIFTELIRERLTEYAEFKSFVPEYRVYANFCETYRHRLGAAWQRPESTDASKLFKTIYTFDRAADRRALLHKLLKVLKADEVFRARLEKKLSKLGFIFLKALEIL